MTSLWLLVAHLIGDYVLQSDWMATEKTRRWWPAWAHGLTYGLPFLFLTQSPVALMVIVVSHAVLDHYRAAKYLVWAKNLVAPKAYRHPWSECSQTGYHKDLPVWLATWLVIIVDNALHLTINAAAVTWL